jgi:hypothetical protein
LNTSLEAVLEILDYSDRFNACLLEFVLKGLGLSDSLRDAGLRLLNLRKRSLDVLLTSEELIVQLEPRRLSIPNEATQTRLELSGLREHARQSR